MKYPKLDAFTTIVGTLVIIHAHLIDTSLIYIGVSMLLCGYPMTALFNRGFKGKCEE